MIHKSQVMNNKLYPTLASCSSEQEGPLTRSHINIWIQQLYYPAVVVYLLGTRSSVKLLIHTQELTFSTYSNPAGLTTTVFGSRDRSIAASSGTTSQQLHATGITESQVRSL